MQGCNTYRIWSDIEKGKKKKYQIKKKHQRKRTHSYRNPMIQTLWFSRSLCRSASCVCVWRWSRGPFWRGEIIVDSVIFPARRWAPSFSVTCPFCWSTVTRANSPAFSFTNVISNMASLSCEFVSAYNWHASWERFWINYVPFGFTVHSVTNYTPPHPLPGFGGVIQVAFQEFMKNLTLKIPKFVHIY